MSEKSKYYTPTIEEFHVGFEYEVFEDWDIEKEKTWHKQVYDILKSNPERLEYVGGDMSKFRVKYLDKEDIESLGFEFNKEYYNNFFKEKYLVFFSKDMNITLSFYPNLKTVGTILYDPSKSKIMYEKGIDIKTINCIKIKNKSELKRLLKQLEDKSDER